VTRRARQSNEDREPPVVRFGDVDAGEATSDLTVTTAIDALPEARFRLSLERTPMGTDYLAPLTIAERDDVDVHALFDGCVLDVAVEVDEARVRCGEGQVLIDSTLGSVATAGMEPAEVAHMAARSSGLSEDRVRIAGLDALPVQVFEVVAALKDVEVSSPVQLGEVRLLPPGVAEPVVRGVLDQEGESAGLLNEFMDADCHALVHVTDSVPYRAEQRGLSTIDWVLAWVGARLRYGLVRLPDGRPQRFSRAEARARPRRARLVAVRGLLSDGRWLREAAIEPVVTLAGESTVGSLGPPSRPSLELRQAMLAAERAAHGSDAVQRVGALWEAIEFLVKDVRTEKALAPAQRRALRERLIEALPEEHQGRVDRLLGVVNDTPLMEKLRLLLEQHGVPFTHGDMERLQALRGVRNAALHGGEAEAIPDPEELDHAVGLLSRLILYRAVGGIRPPS